MATKKATVKQKAFKVPPSLQTTGVRAMRVVERNELKTLHRTGSGRRVALKFATEEGGRETNIYVDDIVKVIERREVRVYALKSRPVKSAAKKSDGRRTVAKKASAKKMSVKYIKVSGSVQGDRFRPTGKSIVIERLSASAASVKSEKPIIPKVIKKFTLHFLNEMRKQVCPKKGAKATLGTTGSMTVNGIAVWIMAHFAIAGALASALASAVLLLIMTATKGAFCAMTADLAKQLIAAA